MKHNFNPIAPVNRPSMCDQCWSLIPVDERDGECIAPVIIGVATENIEIHNAVVVFISPTTGTATVRKARADEELP